MDLHFQAIHIYNQSEQIYILVSCVNMNKPPFKILTYAVCIYKVSQFNEFEFKNKHTKTP